MRTTPLANVMLAVIVEKRKRWEVYLTIALENCTTDLTAAKMGTRNRWEVYLTTYMYINTDKLTAVKTGGGGER